MRSIVLLSSSARDGKKNGKEKKILKLISEDLERRIPNFLREVLEERGMQCVKSAKSIFLSQQCESAS